MSDQPIETLRAVSPRRSWRESTSEFLSLEYVIALGSVVAAVIFASRAVTAAFSLWNNVPVDQSVGLGGMVTSGNGYVAAIVMALAALVFGFLSYVLFGRVTRTVASRPDFTGRLAYRAATYAALGLLAMQLLLQVVVLIAILVGSLVLIGGQTSIKALYLREFLPGIINTVIVGVAAYYVYYIAKGRNKSRLLSLMLSALGVVLFITLVVTVAVRAHDTYSPINDFGTRNSPVRRVDPGADLPFSVY
jgi:hypothetical protein